MKVINVEDLDQDPLTIVNECVSSNQVYVLATNNNSCVMMPAGYWKCFMETIDMIIGRDMSGHDYR